MKTKWRWDDILHTYDTMSWNSLWVALFQFQSIGFGLNVHIPLNRSHIIYNKVWKMTSIKEWAVKWRHIHTRRMRCPFPVHVDRETWTWNHQPKIIKNKWDNTLKMNETHCFVWNWNKIDTLYKLQYFIDYLRFDIIHARLYEAFNKHTHMCIYYWNVLYIRT